MPSLRTTVYGPDSVGIHINWKHRITALSGNLIASPDSVGIHINWKHQVCKLTVLRLNRPDSVGIHINWKLSMAFLARMAFFLSRLCRDPYKLETLKSSGVPLTYVRSRLCRDPYKLETTQPAKLKNLARCRPDSVGIHINWKLFNCDSARGQITVVPTLSGSI